MRRRNRYESVRKWKNEESYKKGFKDLIYRVSFDFSTSCSFCCCCCLFRVWRCEKRNTYGHHAFTSWLVSMAVFSLEAVSGLLDVGKLGASERSTYSKHAYEPVWSMYSKRYNLSRWIELSAVWTFGTCSINTAFFQKDKMDCLVVILNKKNLIGIANMKQARTTCANQI